MCQDVDSSNRTGTHFSGGYNGVHRRKAPATGYMAGVEHLETFNPEFNPPETAETAKSNSQVTKECNKEHNIPQHERNPVETLWTNAPAVMRQMHSQHQHLGSEPWQRRWLGKPNGGIAPSRHHHMMPVRNFFTQLLGFKTYHHCRGSEGNSSSSCTQACQQKLAP